MSIAPFEKRGRQSQAARAKGRLTLTLDDVVRAGADLLDTKGVEGLSMRALAAHMGTGQATLYWHVNNKEQLLRLILDETLRLVVPPTDGVWHERLAATLTRARKVLLARPALVQVIWDSRWNLGPQALSLADAVIAMVAASGIPERDVADAYFAVVTYMLGFVVAESSAADALPFGSVTETADDDPGRQEAEKLYPHLLRYGPGTDAAGMDRRFAVGLNRLIKGIASAD